MAGDVDERDPGRIAAAAQIVGDVVPPVRKRARDAGVEVESLLEVDVDDVITANGAGQRARAAPDVDAAEARHFAGQREQVAGDVLKVFELAHQMREGWVVGRVHGNSLDCGSHHSMTLEPARQVPWLYTICTTAPSGSFTWKPNSMLFAGVSPCCLRTCVAVSRLKPCTPSAK